MEIYLIKINQWMFYQEEVDLSKNKETIIYLNKKEIKIKLIIQEDPIKGNIKSSF